MILLLAGWGHAFAQKKSDYQETAAEHISKKFTLQKPADGSVLAIYNIWGDIKVEGYNGSQVVIEIDQTISARDEAEMARAKGEFKLGFNQKADTVTAYTAFPYDTRPHHNWDDHNDPKEKRYYQVKLNYTVKIPNNMNIRVSTINGGEVDVKDVYGSLKVNNINGPISIVNAKGTTSARTINGNLTVNYLSNPAEESSFYTLNGKLEATFPANLSANVQFKSMNGQFYTDFEDTEALPAEITKAETKNSNGTTYKLNKNTGIRIGKGGRVFKFETLNGNIYIKKA